MNTFSSMKKQDMCSLRTSILMAFTTALDAHIVAEARKCADRLLVVLPHATLHDNRVFVAYGGGKDSSYMVAFVRLIQLLLLEKYTDSFQLIVATNRHSGMPHAVMENIDRVYKAIGAYDDPAVDMLLIDGDKISPFNVDSPLSRQTLEKNCLDILMTGHRCEGNARPTFCNACNLSMIKSFGVVASYGDGVDVVITGDSSREQKAYMAWVRQIGVKVGLGIEKKNHNFNGFLHTMSGIADYYYRDIYGEKVNEELHLRNISVNNLLQNPVFFTIYQDTDYEVGAHWEFLTRFLGFRFDDIAFSFTESDCANPALMAHLRGLKAERVYGRTYKEGILEYVRFAVELMRKKGFPTHLIELMKTRYDTSSAIQLMRCKLDTYAQAVLDLTQEHLICMLYSPFAQQGKNLRSYLEREQPDLSNSVAEIHCLLARTDSWESTKNEQVLALRLAKISHLDIELLRALYQRDLAEGGSSQETLLSIILNRDPHKGVIQTTHSLNGPVIAEIISGR